MNGTRIKFVAGGSALILLIIFMMWRPRVQDPHQANNAGTQSVDQTIRLFQAALAATENRETEKADSDWKTLSQLNADDESIALNLALNRVLRVDQLASKATSAALEESEKTAARSTLPDAISGARAAIESFADQSDDQVTALWMRSSVDLQESNLLPDSMMRSTRESVYDRLATAMGGQLGRAPRSAILGGLLIRVLDRMEDPIDGLPSRVLGDAAETLGSLSDNHPDNLYFALTAARLKIESKDQRAVDYTQRVMELTRAIEPSIAIETSKIGLTPAQLVEQVTTSIRSGDWSTALNRNSLWFNVVNSTQIVKTDRRRATPHPLDLLSFDAYRQFSAKAARANPIEKGNGGISFDVSSLSKSNGLSAIQVIDFDLDLDPDLVVVDSEGLLQLFENSQEGWIEAGEVNLGIIPIGVIVADLFLVDSSDPNRLRADRSNSESEESAPSTRHDTMIHLVAYGKEGVRIVEVDGRSTSGNDSKLKRLESDLGLGELSNITASVAGDLEADGDLDLVFATKNDGIRFFVNRGNRTFFELRNQDRGFGVDDPVSSLAIADLDRDLDLDIVTTHAKSGHVGVLENLLHLQFRGRIIKEIPAIAGASSVAVEDVDGNVSWDLIVGGNASSAIVYSHTADFGSWAVDRVESSEQAGEDGIVVDLDNDSWLEFIAHGKVSRIGPWGWDTWNSIEELIGADRFVASDFNRDGAIDLAAFRKDGVSVLRNESDGLGHYIDLRFKGIDDNASGRVNHYAIGSVIEARFGPHYRARIVTSPSTHFGIDGLERISSVRAILPNGLAQTIDEPEIDTVIEEEQTLKGSCPYLYTWDGDKFAFVTDCLWAAPLGLQVAHGVVAKDRPWEYLKIDGSHLQPKDGRYELRITEELWEIAYFDQVQLSVVDHPPDVDIWTNEKVGPGNIATPTIFAFADGDRRKLHHAVDTSGRDVTGRLATVDQDFVQGFDRRLRQGLCEPHWVDVDFGEWNFDSELKPNGDSKPSVYLVLTGWIMPTDTSLNIQIDQNPELHAIEFPSVWVPDTSSQSGWRNAIPFMGFPGGKTKTIVVDVTNATSFDDLRFRVRTSAQIYWDCAELAIQKTPTDVKTQDAELLSASIGFHGFSHRIRQERRRPESYDYHDATLAAKWPPLHGKLTRFGDCTDLVQTWDDRMAVISAGDEIRFTFGVPPEDPPPGWKRDFVLHNVGWDKDADLNTLSGQQMGPLPFRGMTQYPPGLADASKSTQVQKINQHHLRRSQSFRSFWYREQTAPPMRFGG